MLYSIKDKLINQKKLFKEMRNDFMFEKLYFGRNLTKKKIPELSLISKYLLRLKKKIKFEKNLGKNSFKVYFLVKGKSFGR